MINCIAIDDESLALEQIAGYIRKTPYLNLISKFENAFEALEFLQSKNVDLMFVDIEMPELSGMDFVKSLNNPPKVIFTTAYSQYAVDGFKVNAVDYLLKPIGYTDFLKAADKAHSQFQIQAKSFQNGTKQETTLFVKTGTKHIRINIDDITHIEGMREYVKIHLVNDKPIMTLQSMRRIEQTLSDKKFMRVHRSFVVNLKYLVTVERNRIIFDKDTYIPISEQYSESVKKYIEQNSLNNV